MAASQPILEMCLKTSSWCLKSFLAIYPQNCRYSVVCFGLFICFLSYASTNHSLCPAGTLTAAVKECSSFLCELLGTLMYKCYFQHPCDVCFALAVSTCKRHLAPCSILLHPQLTPIQVVLFLLEACFLRLSIVSYNCWGLINRK